MDKIKDIVSRIKPADEFLLEKTQRRLDLLTKPRGSLGRLEELAKKIVATTGDEDPKFKHKVIFTMAADHGVTEEAISAFPQEVTSQMVYNFLSGQAGINVLARHVGAAVVVIDMGVAVDLKSHPRLINRKVGYGTKNMSKGPAMTEKQAIKAIETGAEVFEEEFSKQKIDILGIGDMGIGNTTSSSAIIAALTGRNPREVTGRGTGITDQTLNHKVTIIEEALSLNKPAFDNPIDILTKVGGFEIGGICGATLAAASRRVPVVMDGFISSIGALLAYEVCPTIREYLVASHNSVEVGHQTVLNRLNLKPLLDLNLRLGEGTGAALGIGIVEAAVKILTEMATFGEAGVCETI